METMMIELTNSSTSVVSGGDVATTIGGWVGAAVSEINEHPIGACFGLVGVIVAHQLTKEK
jgi:hypothetical protein